MKIVVTEEKEIELKSVSIHVKVCDSGHYSLLDANDRELATRQDYVPSFFPGEHYGDYLMLNIDIDTGMILNWKKPNPSMLIESFFNKDNS